MNGRLKALESKLSKGTSTPQVGSDSINGKILTAMQSAMAADSQKALDAMAEQLRKVEEVSEGLRLQINSLQTRAAKEKDMHTGEIVMLNANHKKECDALHKHYTGLINTLQANLSRAKEACTDEHCLRVKAESEYAAECKMRESAEKQLASLRADKTVQTKEVKAIMPSTPPMKPLTMTVSKRDESGRIVAMTIAPST